MKNSLLLISLISGLLSLMSFSYFSVQSSGKVAATEKLADGEEEKTKLAYFIGSHGEEYPAKPAAYLLGKKALMDYMKVNLESKSALVQKENLKNGRIIFVVNNMGLVVGPELVKSSGYPDLDRAALQLIQSTPSAWLPAKDKKGTAISQEMVFTFGIGGC